MQDTRVCGVGFIEGLKGYGKCGIDVRLLVWCCMGPTANCSYGGYRADYCRLDS